MAVLERLTRSFDKKLYDPYGQRIKAKLIKTLYYDFEDLIETFSGAPKGSEGYIVLRKKRNKYPVEFYGDVRVIS